MNDDYGASGLPRSYREDGRHRVADYRAKILWIPHTSWERCAAQRPRILVEQLAKRFDVHVATWMQRRPDDARGHWFYAHPTAHIESLRRESRREGDWSVHGLGVPLPVLPMLKRGYPSQPLLWPSQLRFQSGLRRLVKAERFDAVVVEASHHFTGYPPRFAVPTLFDYLDLHPEHVEARYMRQADRVVVVSNVLADRVKSAYGRSSNLIPNGIHHSRLLAGNRSRGRKRWGLQDRIVISLIGLTCSDRLYFVDAIAAVREEFPAVTLLAVGGGSMSDRIRAKCDALRVPHVLTGWINPEEVPDLYAASDVGLYPGDDSPYFGAACPLKVLEYAATRVPTVVNRAEELIRLGFPGTIIKSATAEAFSEGLREILRSPPETFPDMSRYDWPLLARQFGDEIDQMVSERRSAAASRLGVH
jgi:glycosyltransferase involved in cell wall biosynthesis